MLFKIFVLAVIKCVTILSHHVTTFSRYVKKDPTISCGTARWKMLKGRHYSSEYNDDFQNCRSQS